MLLDRFVRGTLSMACKDKEDVEGGGEGEEEEAGATSDEEELGLDDGTISGQVMRDACQRACASASALRTQQSKHKKEPGLPRGIWRGVSRD
jgi:hypothetical protein